MVKQRAYRRRYNASRLAADMAERGWNPSELARRAEVSHMAVRRSLIGAANPETWKAMAGAIGHPVARYLVDESSRQVSA